VRALAPRRRGLVAAALARAETFLLEPAEPGAGADSPPPPERRAVIAVFGLATGCGATTVARALAAELAARDEEGTAAVACRVSPTGIPLASAAAAQLARVLRDVRGATARAVGRLCLVETHDQPALADAAPWHAPLVIDAGHSAVGGVPAALADQVVLVAGPGVEPALASVAAACLARVAPEPLVVLNRGPAEGHWASRAAVALPDSRMGAQLALSGREARGELGRAIGELADWCEEPP
jgi:hypothetical protein